VSGVLGEIGWRWPFLIYLIGVLIAVVAWAGMPRDRPAQSKAPVAEAAEPKPAAKATAAANWPIRLFVLAFMTGPIFTLPSVYLSFYLPRFGYDGPSMTGGILALSSLVSAVFSASYGRARLRLSIRSIFAIGFAVAGLGLATLALAPNIWFVAAAMTMTGFAAGWVNANVFTAVIESVDEAHRGRALGITQASASLAPAVGVTALEPLVLRMGYSGVYILMGLLAAAVTLAVMVGGVARRRVAPAAAA
jgi:MFS family permease